MTYTRRALYLILGISSPRFIVIETYSHRLKPLRDNLPNYINVDLTLLTK
jgi:hypothetical protein